MSGLSGFCNFSINFRDTSGRQLSILDGMHKTVKNRGGSFADTYLSEHIGISQASLLGNCSAACDGISADVILNGYTKAGLNFIQDLPNGFSFVLWDGERLILCRDRVGIKPLFYTIHNNTLVFGSEQKTLFAHPEITPTIDINSFREIFGLGPAHTPGNGIFKGIHEVLPGHYTIFSREGLKNIKYWELQSHPHEDSYDETLEKTSFLVKDAIKLQISPNTCSLLSGGIDSSIVTAVASEHCPSLNTFSFDFKGNDTHFSSNAFQPERDRPYVDKFLEKYQLNHTYLECDETLLAELLYTSVDSKDLPGMADIDASLLYFCSLVKEHNPIALTGECADEIFGGYPWFHREDLMNANAFPWSQSRDMLLSPDFLAELNPDEYADNRYRESLAKVPVLEGESPLESRRRQIGYLTINWFMQTLLTRMDRAGAHIGLDARTPFADNRIIEYLWNVPWEMKCHDGVVKGLLRESCRDLLPPELLNRKKSPFPKTYNPDYTQILVQNLTDVINNSNSPLLPLIDKKRVLDFLNSPVEYGKPWFGQLMAKPQLIAYLLQVNYWLGKYGRTN